MTFTPFRSKPLSPLRDWAARSMLSCLDWTSTVDSTLVGGVVGDIDANGSSWTNLAVGYCSPFSRRLYCFEQ